MPKFKYSRIAYHSDNTYVGYHFGQTHGRKVKDLTPDALRGLNDVGRSAAWLTAELAEPGQPVGGFTYMTLRFLFPSPMRIEGMLPLIYQYYPNLLEANLMPVTARYSRDSLTGDDGTWVELGQLPMKPKPVMGGRDSFSSDSLTVPGAWHRTAFSIGESRLKTLSSSRTLSNRDTKNFFMVWTDPYLFRTLPNTDTEGGIVPMRLRHVRAMEFTVQVNFDYLDSFTQWDAVGNLFLYGDSEPTYWEQGLQIREVDRTDPISPYALDLGTVPIHSSQDVLLRVANTSPDLSADNIVVDMEPIPDTILYPRYKQFLLSLDGMNFSESVRIGELSPGASSPIIYLRRITGAEHPTGTGPVIVRATAERWF